MQVCLVRLPQELLVRERIRIADHVGEDVRHLGNVSPYIFDLVHLDHSHRLRTNDQILHEANLDRLLHLVANEQPKSQRSRRTEEAEQEDQTAAQAAPKERSDRIVALVAILSEL